MKRFTVIGLWEGNGDVFKERVIAKDGFAAIQKATAKIVQSDELCIVGAVSGWPEFHHVGCDNEKTAYACDLQPEEE